jgi:hypothetical protein
MLTIQRFTDAVSNYQDGKQPLRLLQDQAVILINCCRNPYRYIPEAFDITDADIDCRRAFKIDQLCALNFDQGR